MDEITLLPSLSAREVKTIAITRLNQRFEPLLNLAQLFLDHESLRFSAGDLTTFAFVFDMNKLFETFVIRFIQRHRQEVLPGSLQNCELLPQARGAIRYLAQYQNRPIFQLQPDLAFRRGSEFPLLLDTKYKLFNDRERKLGVAKLISTK
jgi:5-methylcytosine-specific restriction enzyme subunit McrC